MTCKTCNGRGKVQSGYAGEELIDCPDCTPCKQCNGTGAVDSGGMMPDGTWATLPCPACQGRGKEIYALAAIGAAWLQDSSLEKWFPFAAKELSNLKNQSNAIAKNITLTEYDKEALRIAFEHGEPVAADILARYTGLDPIELKRAGIVRTIGRWGDALYKGENFPK